MKLKDGAGVVSARFDERGAVELLDAAGKVLHRVDPSELAKPN